MGPNTSTPPARPLPPAPHFPSWVHFSSVPLSCAGSLTLLLQAISEPTLVRDVLYAAQGVRGCVVGWVPGPPGAARDLVSGFRPDSATVVGLGPGRAMLLDRLTELGWLFR